MKLLFFIHAISGGGAERVLTLLCNELVERGYDVFLATNTYKPFVYHLSHKINVVQLHCSNYQKIPKFIRVPWMYYKIRKISKSISPDLIISFINIFNARVILSTLGLHIPVIASEHTSYQRKLSFLENIARFHIDKLASRVVILTQQDYVYLGKRMPNKIVIPNPTTFLPFKSANKEDIILAIGRLDQWKIKGFDILLNSWSNIHTSHPDWRLVIAGTGRKENIDILNNMCHTLGVIDSVDFVGFINDIEQLMRRSAIFVLSSRNEGFPMVLIEAMSQKCACISTDCLTGPREIIENNRNGILIKVEDVQELSFALEKLITDSTLRNVLSNNALNVADKFSLSTIVDKWESLFYEVENNNKKNKKQ